MIDAEYKTSPEKFMKYLSDREYAISLLTKKAVDDFMKFNYLRYWVNKFVSNPTAPITFTDDHIAYMVGKKNKKKQERARG